MRGYDRDYYMGCFAVLMDQRRHIIIVLDDMSMRIEEMEEQFVTMCNQQESDSMDSILTDAIEEIITWDENDDLIYDSSRKRKECMCDDCWGVTKPTDFYEHRMD